MHLLSPLLLSLLFLFFLPSPTLPLPLSPRSAPFNSLTGLTPLTSDHSRAPPPRHAFKYFTESSFHPHYDGRFAASPLSSASERRFHLALLVRSYAAFARRAGVRTWIMHGSLLGWWWAGGVLGWDSDVDFCVGEEGVLELAGWWNMTVHGYEVGELGVAVADDEGVMTASGHERIPRPDALGDKAWRAIVAEGKKFLLEVNPHHTDASTGDTLNRIDARWIDVHTGLFIDITTVHPVPRPPPPRSILASLTSLFAPATPQRRPEHTEPEDMYTKDTHLYATAALFPLRSARFEGTTVQVPYAYEQLLIEEYGPRALTETWFNGFRFEREKAEWVVAPPGPVAGFVQGEGGARGGRRGGRRGGSVRVDGGEGARSAKDNQGQGGYQARPGRVGDVHVVPGSG